MRIQNRLRGDFRMKIEELLGRTALKISNLWPPDRDDKSEYFDIWWASHHMIYEGKRPTQLWSGEIGNTRKGFGDWILKKYCKSGDTIWENVSVEKMTTPNMIRVYSNGSFYFMSQTSELE